MSSSTVFVSGHHRKKSSLSSLYNIIKGKNRHNISKPKGMMYVPQNNNESLSRFNNNNNEYNKINSIINTNEINRSDTIAVGIRLGQRWCSVSAIENGKITDIVHKIPTLVTFTKERTFYGTAAIRQSIANISNSVYGFFGLLGRK